MEALKLAFKVALRIAWRYFFAKEKRNFIHVLTFLSLLGVGIGTAAMIVVLSVFNGMQALTLRLHAAHNPSLQISAASGKTFEVHEDLLKKIKQVSDIKAITEVIEDNALVRFNETNLAIRMKGVGDNHSQQYDLKKHLLRGEFLLKTPQNGLYYAVLGLGVMINLNIPLGEPAYPLVFWYPKRGKKVSIDPTKAFLQASLIPIGVVSVEQQFDMNTVLVPIEFARELTQYSSKTVTQLELAIPPESNAEATRNAVRTILGNGFVVKTAIEQQAVVLRAFQIERLFAYVALVFVMVVASFNIFFSLMMLVIEKKRDIGILRAMGSSSGLIKQIFWWESFLIGGFGVLVGCLVGFALVYAQEQYGLVSMGVASAVQESYPVELQFFDFVLVALTVLVITTLAGLFPAYKASQLGNNKTIG